MATFTNQATMTYNGNTVNSNVVTGEIVQALTIDKTAVGTSYEPDGVVAYVVNIRNSGAAPITGLTLTDDLGTYSFTPTGGTAVQLTPLTYVADSMRYFQNGVEQTAPTVTAGANGFSVTGLNVPAGGVATLAYRARVNGFANTGAEGTVENTVTLTGGGLIEPVTATETVNAAQDARLSIRKALSPAQVNDNGTLTYTFVIENRGSAAAGADANITVSDTFEPILNNIGVTYSGDTWAAANYTYNEATGVFRTTPGAITVPAATVAQDPTTGVWTTVPGSVTLEITGTI